MWQLWGRLHKNKLLCRGKIDSHKPHIHDYFISRLCTGSSIKKWRVEKE
jgi:hypothetical protein